MTILEAARRIDMSDDNSNFVDICKMGELFNIDVDWQEQDRLKSYWLTCWNCTDTWVGTQIYFLDDEPVAYSTQTGRKSDEVISFFNLKSALKVKEYLLSLESVGTDNLNIIDINTEIGDSYKIEWNNQLVKKDNVSLLGTPMTIVETIKHTKYGLDTKIIVEDSNGILYNADITNIDFKFNLKDNVSSAPKRSI